MRKFISILPFNLSLHSILALRLVFLVFKQGENRDMSSHGFPSMDAQDLSISACIDSFSLGQPMAGTLVWLKGSEGDTSYGTYGQLYLYIYSGRELTDNDAIRKVPLWVISWGLIILQQA